MESNAHVDSTELYDTVAALLSRERYAEVLELLERLGDGDNVRVAYARLLCLQKLGRVEEALTYSGEVESAYHDPVVSMFLASDRRFAFRPETEWASLIASLYVFKEAALVYREKKYGEALSLLASAELQNHPEILYARGRCLLKLGRLDEALNCAALLELEQEPARAKMLREKAKAYHPPILKTVPAAPPQPSDETVKDLEPPLPPPDPTTLDQVVSPALSPGLEPSPASAADAQLLLDAIAERDQLQEALTTQRTLVVHLQEQLADYETRNGELQRQLEAVREELHNLSEQRGTHEAAAHEATAAALRDLEIVRSPQDVRAASWRRTAEGHRAGRHDCDVAHATGRPQVSHHGPATGSRGSASKRGGARRSVNTPRRPGTGTRSLGGERVRGASGTGVGSV